MRARPAVFPPPFLFPTAPTKHQANASKRQQVPPHALYSAAREQDLGGIAALSELLHHRKADRDRPRHAAMLRVLPLLLHVLPHDPGRDVGPLPAVRPRHGGAKAGIHLLLAVLVPRFSRRDEAGAPHPILRCFHSLLSPLPSRSLLLWVSPPPFPYHRRCLTKIPCGTARRATM